MVYTDIIKIAEKRHKGQKLRDGESYINHCIRVGCTAAMLIPESSDYSFAMGVLHDIVEDTEITFEELREELIKTGVSDYEASIIVDGVLQLTDYYTKEQYPNLNRAERKKHELERILSLPKPIQEIKMIDVIDNLRNTDSLGDFAKVYIPEKAKLIELAKVREEIKLIAFKYLQKAIIKHNIKLCK